MSRTNKDKPLYARATWWTPEHWGCRHDIPRPWGNVPLRDCDLPAEPSASSYDKTASFGPRSGWTCTWEPVPDPLRDRATSASPPAWYVAHIGHNVNRREEREYSRKAIAEHRATGDVDTVLPSLQHRHRAQWLWW